MNGVSSNIAPSEALLGRYVGASGAPIDDGAPLDITLPALAEAPAPQPDWQPRQIETGIKVLDLFAPIVRGGAISMIAGAGVGKTVLIVELVQRVATRRGGCAVLASLDDDGFSKQDVIAELRSSGVEPYVATVLGQRADPPGTAAQVARAGLALAEDLCARGRETLLFLDELLVTSETVWRLRQRVRGGEAGLTVFVLQHKTPLDGKNKPLDQLLAERDGQLVFSRALAKQNIWPAVDPLQSSSRLLDARLVSEEHARVASAARELLQHAGVVDGAGDPNAPLYGRARRAMQLLTQPFYVAETFTALPGEYVPLDETIRCFGELLAGNYDERPEEDLRFKGTIG